MRTKGWGKEHQEILGRAWTDKQFKNCWTIAFSFLDSAADALHNPEKYCTTEFKISDLPGNQTQATLDIIRER